MVLLVLIPLVCNILNNVNYKKINSIQSWVFEYSMSRKDLYLEPSYITQRVPVKCMLPFLKFSNVLLNILKYCTM